MNPALPLTILWALMIVCAWRLHRSAAITPIHPIRPITPIPDKHAVRDDLYRKIQRAIRERRDSWSAIL